MADVVSSSKEPNPKDLVAVDKAPLHLVPSSLGLYASLAFAEGALKYGAFNWRASPVRASVYLSALGRHLAKWTNGEELDQKTMIPHLANAVACLGIIIDAAVCGTLIDDRPVPAPMAEEIDSAERVIAHLRTLFKDRNPRHITRETLVTDGAPADLAKRVAEHRALVDYIAD